MPNLRNRIGTSKNMFEKGRPRALAVSRRPIDITDVVAVVIQHSDAVIAAGLVAVLESGAEFSVRRTLEELNGPTDARSAPVIVADYSTALLIADRSHQLAQRLIIYTGTDSQAMVCRAVQSGVRGYLVYGATPQELCRAVRAVSSGETAMSPSVAMRVIERIRGRSLTERETSVLEQLMCGLSNKCIARALNLSTGTVKTHMKSILEKLGVESRTAAVVTAQRRGLLGSDGRRRMV